MDRYIWNNKCRNYAFNRGIFKLWLIYKTTIMGKIKLLICLLSVSFIYTVSAQEKNDAWDYPVKPGTNAWKALKNNTEKVQACHVPDDILFTAKTPELLRICLSYPLLPDIFAFNNIKDGFEKFETDFNGFRELIKRDDVSNELLKKYKTLDPAAIPTDGTILEKGTYVFSFSFIELFISHPLVIEKNGLGEKQDIVQELLLIKEKKKHRPAWYQDAGLQTSYLAIVNVILSDSTEFQSGLDVSKVSSYIYSGILISPEIPDQIDQAANKYLKND